MATTPTQPQLLQGTLEVMILSVLADRAEHGYGIAREIERRSGSVLTIEEGSLYPALHRLQKRGDLTFEWRASHTNRRAKYYALSRSGQRLLQEQRSLWHAFVEAASRVVGHAPAGTVWDGRPSTAPEVPA